MIQVLTSDRYIAIKAAHGLTFAKTLRILSKDGKITPARWSEKNQRLESVAINNPDAPVMMYEKSAKVEQKLIVAGINFEWLTLEQAKELTA